MIIFNVKRKYIGFILVFGIFKGLFFKELLLSMARIVFVLFREYVLIGLGLLINKEYF